MSKYELSDEQVKNLIILINNSTFKGEQANIVIDLKRSLNNPTKDE